MFIKIHQRRQEGFTLVELIIVLAIIGILTALAISRISYNRTRAAKTTCNGIMGDVKKATEAYYADSGYRLDTVEVSVGNALVSANYMAGVPKSPHGNAGTLQHNGNYYINFPATSETATIDCPWKAVAGDPWTSFPSGHTF